MILVSAQDVEQEQILTIDFIFSNAINHFHELSTSIGLVIPFNNDQPTYYRYLQIHLNLIEKLLSYEQAHLTSSELPLFSVQDESILSRSVSFIILLGLVLHFDEGIFLSIENYLKYSQSSIHLLKLKTHLSHHDRMHYLNQTLNFLMKSIKNSFVIQRLYSKYLLEIILSHLQLLYSPNLKYSSENILNTNLQDNLTYLQNHFSNLFIQQILLLNRLLSTNINSPVWLKNRCGDLLTSILIHPNNRGIHQILQTIFDSTLPNDRLYTSVAKILSTCPKQLKPEEYIQRIKPQFLELLHDQRYMPVISISINELLKKYQKLIEDELFTIIFQPLLSCRNHLSNERFELFIDDLFNLIVLQPNEQIRIYLLENYLNELMNIYLALESSLSSLKLKFFNIIKILFSSTPMEITIEHFKRILFNFQYLYLKFVPDISSTCNLIIDKTNPDNPEIFCQLLTKILFSIDNNDGLIVKIFLDLLQLLITNDSSTERPNLWTEADNQIIIKQYKIMQILKHILEYLTEHIDIFIKNVNDTIKVLQVFIMMRKIE